MTGDLNLIENLIKYNPQISLLNSFTIWTIKAEIYWQILNLSTTDIIEKGIFPMHYIGISLDYILSYFMIILIVIL